MSAAISAAISLRGVGKNFGKLKVLDRVSFDVAQGEIVALLGSSGCGKSTLLNMIAGLLEASEGELWIDGKRTEGTKDRNSLSYMFRKTGCCRGARRVRMPSSALKQRAPRFPRVNAILARTRSSIWSDYKVSPMPTHISFRAA